MTAQHAQAELPQDTGAQQQMENGVPVESTTDQNVETHRALQDWRMRVLNTVLVTAVVVILPAYIQTVQRAYRYPAERNGAILLSIIYLCLVILAILRRLDPTLRGWGVLAVTYCVAVVAMARGGLVGDGRVYLVVLPILAVTLVGVRAGIYTLGLALLTYSGFAILAVGGILDRWLIMRDNPLAIDHWVYDGIVMATLMVVALVIVINFYNFQVSSLESEQRITQALQTAYDQLEVANQTLELKIRQRTKELAETNKRLQHLATHDPLTGLPNRVLFFDRLEHALARALREKKQVAVLFIDLDNFKEINDTFGHEEGDRVLRTAADRLRESVRASDTICRMAGDEFAIILEDLSADEQVPKVAHKVLGNLTRPLKNDWLELVMTASIGISSFPGDGDTPAELLKNADHAMYKVKNQGKNGVQAYKRPVAGAGNTGNGEA